ncbi:gliding-associated putative ABC transporter substrate-binding component GldG [Gillisia sp. Hel1_33_143]|uniref:gliding motility-associated ABC transporter substrate-binding protein GldG n=1 Tax=Gillisia sp. Hel1_33_143 TaxID=1336796 RepID=UPI00087B2185|nr:gliding motility-associated ABC transporter substrate-binding protein GldG [Gillisia sp. Hel1_33_143]SDS74130.1 gliding-associated putative ABC transporter substrate-binding component GldG [Gillisia sp. Hel1_33_143]
MKNNSSIKYIAFLFLGLVLINFLASRYHQRFDLTEDNRYTLSPAAKDIIADVKSPVIIDVFLKGNFPSEFRRLENETRQMLEEFSAYNSNIRFNFIDPLEEGEDANAIAEEFYKLGMSPARVNVQENGKASETLIFPWATANFNDRTVKISLLKNTLGATNEDRVNNSVQQLEYNFADALSRLVHNKEKKIAVMRGNGELGDAYIADFIKTVRQYYYVAPFTLDSVSKHPQRTLQELNEFDLVLEAKPTIAYTEDEKLVLDQYLMQGGKALWLTENVAIETDSLFNELGATLAFPRALNLGDLFFSYGVRINPVLINDLYSAPIILAQGNGSETQFTPYPWFYSPLTSSLNTHPIINNIEAVKFDWANNIDTLKNGIKKTILLTSSPRSKIEGVPREINLNIISTKPDISTYNAGEQPLAVLLEGEFKSVYKHRVKPFDLKNGLDKSVNTSMIVISDGDVIKNQLQKGQPLELGFDRYTGNSYGNKEFLLNAVNYLLDDSGLIDIRSKEVSIAFLNLERIAEERSLWQLLNVVLPILLLSIGAFMFGYYRKKKYKK